MPTAPLEVRTADPAEHLAVADLTAQVYADEFGARDYVATLRDVGRRAEQAEVLVAVEGPRVLGAVTVVTRGGDYAEQADPGDAVIRMLVVDPTARGLGVGRALVRACLTTARRDGCVRVRLSTQTDMTAAHRLYEGFGFVRTPDRDWSPVPGLSLLTYVLEPVPEQP